MEDLARFVVSAAEEDIRCGGTEFPDVLEAIFILLQPEIVALDKEVCFGFFAFRRVKFVQNRTEL